MTRSASLEIHHINVSQGDSTLIIIRKLDLVAARIQAANKPLPANSIDYVPFAVGNNISLLGTVEQALLIDGGNDEFGGDVIIYLTTHGVLDPSREGANGYVDNLAVMINHFHDDHIGGLRSVFKKLSTVPATRKRKKDQPAPQLVDRYWPKTVYVTDDRKTGEDPTTGARYLWLWGDIDNAMTKPQGTTLVRIAPGGLMQDKPLVINMGSVAGIPITLTCIAAGRAYSIPTRGPTNTTYKVRKIPSTPSKPDQNDRSIALVLQYGSFRYFLGGDLAGNGTAAGGNTYPGTAMDASTKRAFSIHTDVESALGGALKKHFPATTAPAVGEPKFQVAGFCTGFKANHHASSSSNDVYFLSTLQPVFAVITSGLRTNFHHHPTAEVLTRLNQPTSSPWSINGGGSVANTISRFYVTEIANRYKGVQFTRTLTPRGKLMGDIIVRPIDETIQAVQARNSFNGQVEIQIYGTGDYTSLPPNGKTSLIQPTNVTYSNAETLTSTQH